MVLFLDHWQRLSVIALLGVQRATVAEMRTFWRLQDLLALSDAEKEAIDYRVVVENNLEQFQWNRAKSLPAKQYEVSEAEAARIRRCLEEWPQFFTAVDRQWLEPLLEQLADVKAQPVAVQR
jgi:biopolymer transport protein ExbB/TolQ